MADQNPSDNTSPALPPIPTIPFQIPSSDRPAGNASSIPASSVERSSSSGWADAGGPAPSTPTEIAAAPPSSPIESDPPASGAGTALNGAPQPPPPALTSPDVTATAPVNPVSETPKGPLYEDPDKVKVPGAA